MKEKCTQFSKCYHNWHLMIIDEQFLVSEKNSWMAAILDFYHQKNFFEGYIPGNKYSYIFLLCKNQTSGLCFWEQNLWNSVNQK